MKKIFALILVLALCLPLCACGGEKIKTEGDAIQEVRDELRACGDSRETYSFVAYGIGLKVYYNNSVNADWRATKNELGVWEVTCSGTMTGETSAGKEKTYKFLVTATVTENGDVKGLRVEKQ